MGKGANRCFDAGPQDFFCLNPGIIRPRRGALPIHHTARREAERSFKFANNDGDKYDSDAAV
ncbi:MAG: hypothetical protein ACOY6K_21670 [Pseudomonadota bacterium]